MSEQELARLVEKIVIRVMERMTSDENLASLIKDENIDKDKWARTCSTYRHTNATAAPSHTISSEPPIENKVEIASKKLYTERDIVELAKAGQKTLVVTRNTILTPSAKDAAASKGIKINVEKKS